MKQEKKREHKNINDKIFNVFNFYFIYKMIEKETNKSK